MGIGILEADESSIASSTSSTTSSVPSSIIESSSINMTADDILLPKLICHDNSNDSNDENLNCTNINMLSADNLIDESYHHQHHHHHQQQQQQLQKEQEQQQQQQRNNNNNNNQQLSQQYLHRMYFQQLKQKYLKESKTVDNMNVSSSSSSSNNSSCVNTSVSNSCSQIFSNDNLNNTTNNINLCETKKISSIPPSIAVAVGAATAAAAATTVSTQSSVTLNNTPANNNYMLTNTNIEIYLDNNNCSKSTDRILKKFGNSSSSSNTTNSNLKIGRSPLSIVSFNNNSSNTPYQNTTLQQTQIQPTTTDISKKNQYHHYHHLQHQQQQHQHYNSTSSSNESFFIYRNPTIQKDPFNKLSDEMILQIFKWLPKKALSRCCLVCRRFNQVAHDESLWTRLDLSGRILKSESLGYILPRGVVILRLAHTELRHPIFDINHIENLIDYETKLQYLDLSMAVISKPSLKMLLSKCRKLKKLSLEHVKLNDEICMEISKNCNLEALNLTMCDGIESWNIKNMMTELKQLHSLNISWTSLNVESIKALVDCVTTDLLRLNIAGCRKAMFDSHLATLSKRCPGLLELDLSDCTALTSAAIDLICNFNELEYLSLSRCYGISASSYMKLNNLSSLSYLDVFGLLSDAALTVLQNAFPTVGINKFIYSSVARPTVGTRRTSIWGLRTRD